MSSITMPSLQVPVAMKRPLLVLMGLLLAVLLLYRGTATEMVGIWSRSDTFAHAFLVPPISLWLIWRGRDRLVALQPRPSLIWLLPLALAALAWLLGQMATVNALMQFALVAMIVCLVPLVLGWPAARAMLFPLLFLFFCVPVGEFLLPVLMEGTADFTVAALRLSGVPVFREGLQFVIPSGNWSVVEACSGVRYLIASMMVGSLFAYLNYQSLKRRLIFVGVSIVVPIIANWVRAYMIVMLGHLSNNRIATGVDHLVYGWVFFGVVITIMFMIGARWSEPDRVPVSAPAPAADSGASQLTAGSLASAAAAALLMLALPPATVRAMESRITTAPVHLAWPVQGQAGWAIAAATDGWQPRFMGASDQKAAAYVRQGQTAGLYLGYYRAQGPDRKLVSSVNSLVASNDPIWSPVETSWHDTLLDGATVRWQVTHLIGRTGGVASPRKHLTVWQTYWVNDSFTASDMQAKLRGIAGQLVGQGDDGAVLILHAQAEPREGGNQLLAAFAEAQLPALRQALRQTRDAR